MSTDNETPYLSPITLADFQAKVAELQAYERDLVKSETWPLETAEPAFEGTRQERRKARALWRKSGGVAA